MTTSDSVTPSTIGKYQIMETLGSGSMGVVYKASDPEIGRTVAIKTLRNVYLGDDSNSEAMQRFRQESRSAGKLRHPNIVTIFEAGRTENSTPYIVMEFIEGQSLEDAIKERAPLDPIEALHLLGQVGSAIDYAHAQGVIHRDIKPSNVIIDLYIHPHLLDFGVAKLSDTSLTPAGMVVGTPSYMSPEQIRGEQLDGGTDRFALAVMAFELFTGVRPFPGADFTTVVSNIIHKPPFTLAEAGANNLPRELEVVLHRALAKERQNRYPSCANLIDELGRCFGVLVDGSGIPGYRKGMRLSDVPGARSAGVDKTANGAGIDADKTTISGPSLAGSDALASSGANSSVSSSSSQKAPEPWEVQRAERRGSGLLPLVGVVLLAGAIGAGYIATEGQDSIRPILQSIESLIGSGTQSEGSEEDNESADTQIVKNDEVKSSLSVSSPSATMPVSVSSTTTVLATTTSTTLKSDVSEVSSDSLVEEHTVSLNNGVTPVATIATSPGDPALLKVLNDTNAEPKALTQAITDAAKGDPLVYLPYLFKLANHPSYSTRIDVLRVFSTDPKFKTKEVYGVIVSKLDDPEFLVRGYAAKVLGSIGNEAALKILETRLSIEQHDVVKRVLQDAVNKIKQEHGGTQ